MVVIAVPIVVGVAFGLVLLWFNSRKPYIRAQDLARSASWFALWLGTWGPQIWSRRKRWHAAAEIGLLGAAAMVSTITAAEARRRLDHAGRSSAAAQARALVVQEHALSRGGAHRHRAPPLPFILPLHGEGQSECD